jgi:hypothetical protein
MKDITGFNLEIGTLIRSIIPGFFASFLFLIAIYYNCDTVKLLVTKISEINLSMILLIIFITSGLIIENIGSRIEEKCIWEKLKKQSKEDIQQEWWDYLKLKIDSEPKIIGQRYLRTILLRFKFELSFSVSLIFMTIGFLYLQFSVPELKNNSCINFILLQLLLPLGVARYLIFEAYESSKLLIEVRRQILDSCLGDTQNLSSLESAEREDKTKD